jgi:hypothetical protein
MLAAHITETAAAVVGGLPPLPEPAAPPGSELITQVVGYIRWIAGIAILIGFFAGLALFAGGRIADHHRFGRMGTITMMAAFGSAFLYAIGYALLSAFASGT